MDRVTYEFNRLMAAIDNRVKASVRRQLDEAMADLLNAFNAAATPDMDPVIIVHEPRRRSRRSPQQMVLDAVKKREQGMAISDLESELGYDRNKVRSHLLTLRNQGKIRMEGEKRHAKYFVV